MADTYGKFGYTSDSETGRYVVTSSQWCRKFRRESKRMHICFLLWSNSWTWATVISFLKALDHQRWHTTVSRTPLGEKLARCSDLYASCQPSKTLALDRSVAGICYVATYVKNVLQTVDDFYSISRAEHRRERKQRLNLQASLKTVVIY
jgi:hypothetical protein